MKNKESGIYLEDQQSDFLYKKNKSNLDISFNRIAFIFFIFFIIFLIYSIHLIHMGSRKSKTEIDEIKIPINKLYRAGIVDRNNNLFADAISKLILDKNKHKLIKKQNVKTIRDFWNWEMAYQRFLEAIN